MFLLPFLLGPVLNIAYGIGKYAVSHMAKKAKEDIFDKAKEAVISKASEVAQAANNYLNPNTNYNTGLLFKKKLVEEIAIKVLEKLLVEKLLFNHNNINENLKSKISRLENQTNAKINVISSHKKLLECLFELKNLKSLLPLESSEIEHNEELKKRIFDTVQDKKLFFYLIKLFYFLKNTLNKTSLSYYDYPQFNLEMKDIKTKDNIIENLSELIYQDFIKLDFGYPEQFYYDLSSQIHELISKEFNKADTTQNNKLLEAVMKNKNSDEILRIIVLGAEIDIYHHDEGLACIHMAVINNNSKVVACLLENGVNPNVVAKQIYRHTMGNYRGGHRPLTIAIDYGYVEIVKLLLAHNAEVNFALETKGKLDGRSPLILAVRDANRRLLENNEKVIAALLRQGANSNFVPDRGKWRGWTALGLAVFNHDKTISHHHKIVSLLLRYQASPNVTIEGAQLWKGWDPNGWTPLALAINNKGGHDSHHQLAVIKTLLDHDADPYLKINVSDLQYNKKAPIEMAAKHPNKEIFKLFENRLKVKPVAQELNSIKSGKNIQQNDTHSSYLINHHRLFNTSFNTQEILRNYLKNALIDETDFDENKIKSKENNYDIITFPSLELAEGFHKILSKSIPANVLSIGSVPIEMDDESSQYKILLSHEHFQILMQFINKAEISPQAQNNNNNIALPSSDEIDADYNLINIDENNRWRNITCTIS